MHQILKSLTFQIEHLPTERRELVIPTTGIVELRRWTLAGVGDQALFDQPFQRAVQRCWPQPHLPAAPFQHVLHDAVAMLLAPDQADENVEPVALERQERVGLRFWHANYISSDMYMRQVLSGWCTLDVLILKEPDSPRPSPIVAATVTTNSGVRRSVLT